MDSRSCLNCSDWDVIFSTETICAFPISYFQVYPAEGFSFKVTVRIVSAGKVAGCRKVGHSLNKVSEAVIKNGKDLEPLHEKNITRIRFCQPAVFGLEFSMFCRNGLRIPRNCCRIRCNRSTRFFFAVRTGK